MHQRADGQRRGRLLFQQQAARNCQIAINLPQPRIPLESIDHSLEEGIQYTLALRLQSVEFGLEARRARAVMRAFGFSS
ncbi:MAG: hypothetical protein M3371_00655 [Acidobacteriota bacterium]|nr:hypothetical protein [Acidobacteriota bacterium]